MNLSDFFISGSIISLEGNHLLIGWGEKKHSSHPTATQKPQFFFPDFFLTDEKPWHIHPHWIELETEALIRILSQAEKKLPSINWNSPYKKTFLKFYSELEFLIKSDKLEKGVPYTFEESSLSMDENRLHHCLLHLLCYARNNSIKIYGSWDSAGGILGGTPETLFHLQKTPSLFLSTMACAGTQQNSIQRLLNSPKDLHEHQLVVLGIVEALSPFGKVDIRQTTTLTLPTLSHLITPIEVSLNSTVSYDSLVQALHPTPALGAFPRDKGIEWLTHYQKELNRGRYGAPVGVLQPGDKSDFCYVAIRNVQWNEKKMWIGAGCGVTAASDSTYEWEEIQLKLAAIKGMLDL